MILLISLLKLILSIVDNYLLKICHLRVDFNNLKKILRKNLLIF